MCDGNDELKEFGVNNTILDKLIALLSDDSIARGQERRAICPWYVPDRRGVHAFKWTATYAILLQLPTWSPDIRS